MENDLTGRRIAKLQQLRDRGIEPYAYRYEVTHSSREVIAGFDCLTATDQPVSLAGRIMLLRPMGKAGFAQLRDRTGTIQIYLRLNEVGEDTYQLFRMLDLGDIVGVEGTVFKTRTGEITIWVQRLQLLSKSLRPLPEKWHGLRDKETRYRRRYLDLIVNPEVQQLFFVRTRMVDSLRTFLNRHGYIEVETPILQPLYGGALARPFVTYHNALDRSLYLRIADELYLKRLIVGGLERVYEFSRDFRNEGMDKDHHPEFTMLEFYQAYADYRDMMNLVEQMIVTVARDTLGTTRLVYRGHTISLEPPWQRAAMIDLIEQQTGLEVAVLSDEALEQACRERNLAIRYELGRGQMIQELFEQTVQPHLVQPTFVTDFPVEVSPFAKYHRSKPGLTERFEVFIGGDEFGNAFSELNDPLDQRDRFEQQNRRRELGDQETQLLDEDYLRALEYGMPPTGGVGIGIDRLTMLLTDAASIREVILFPQMRPERGSDTGDEQ